jgi:hypothetical protein
MAAQTEFPIFANESVNSDLVYIIKQLFHSLSSNMSDQGRMQGVSSVAQDTVRFFRLWIVNSFGGKFTINIFSRNSFLFKNSENLSLLR